MDNSSWDPLSFSENQDPEVFNDATRRQIKNILKSYVGRYDPFCELIQNALDSVDKRETIEDDASYKKCVWITIDLKNNQLSVTDNGVGFKEDEFKQFLAPNVSFKDSNVSRGHKGVGATYIAYGFNYLQVGTKRSGYSFVGEIEQGRSWVEDNASSITRPKIQKSNLIDSYFDETDTGATFTIKFGDTHSKYRDLNWLGANTAQQWSYLLLSKTPLGSIERHGDDEYSSVNVVLTVIKKDGTKDVLNDVKASFLYPHQHISHSTNLSEVKNIQKKKIQDGKDPSQIAMKYTKSNAIYESFSCDASKSLLSSISEEEQVLLETHKPEIYAYFAYSTSVWDQFNDEVAGLRKGMRFLKGGLQIANDKMIQGEPLIIPLTSNIGYQNQCFVLVHFEKADPDLGRKGFQPELRELAEKLSVGAVNQLKSWKDRLLKQDTGAKGVIHKEAKLDQWIKDQESHEKTQPLQILNSNFFAPTNEISITSAPQSEQDVIVLFNQLIAGGVIRGLNLLATSQIQQYDGIYRYVVKKPFENHIYNKDTNPLGVSDFTHSEELTSKAKILEYKYNLDALIHEFECEEKRAEDIHLAVVWELGSEYKKNYTPISLLDLNNLNHREFHGLTHILNSNTSNIHVICLKELVEYLNDIDGVQEYHIARYGDDI